MIQQTTHFRPLGNLREPFRTGAVGNFEGWLYHTSGGVSAMKEAFFNHPVASLKSP